MRVLKGILYGVIIVFSLGLLAFSGFFLWNAIPRTEEPPEVLGTEQIFQPEEQPTEPPESSLAPDLPEPEEEVEQVPEEPEQTAPETEESLLAQTWLKTMSLDEKIWQLFFVAPEAITGVEQATRAGETTKAALESMPVGGLCYFAGNLEDQTQVQQMLANTQSYARTPLFLGVDEEGGVVSRAGANDALDVTHFESAQTYGRQADAAQVYTVGKTLAQQLGALGFNLDFAPVADVVTNPENTEIGSRSYSSDPQVAGALVAAMVEGLQGGNLVSCLKHFPGHGSTQTDSHLDKSVSDRTLEQLRQTEWVPFQAGIDAGAAFVMLSHLTNENLAETPCSLSAAVVDYLRQELQFSGIIITDSQQMGAITSYYSSGEAAVMALQAGADMILMPADLQAAFDAVKAAVADGTLSQSRIDESVLRILQTKVQFGILQ